MFSHIKWYHIIFLPMLLFSYLLYRVESWQSFSLMMSALAFVGGFLLWTFAEYLLHRFVFHSEYWLPDSRLIRYLHYILHGIHHMLPNDPYFKTLYRDRLVHPPILLSIELSILFPLAIKIIRIHDPILFAFFWIGFGIGYICYDLTHYMLHHVDTSKHKGSFFHKLQKYHNQHHFGG